MSTSFTIPARRSSIRRTLLVFTLTLVLLPSLVIGLVGAILGYRAELQSTHDQLSAAADLKQREIDRWVEERESDLAVLADETALQESLHTMLQSPEGSPERLAAYSETAVRLRSFLRKKVAFVELSLLDAETGVIVVSTEVSAEGQPHAEETYFRKGKEGLFLQPPILDPAINAPTILIARPVPYEGKQRGSVQDTNGHLQAVLVGRANLADLGTLVQARIGLGTTGETYLVSKERFYLAGSRTTSLETVKTVTSTGVRTALSGKDGVEQYLNYRGERVIGAFRWLPNLRVALLIEQSQAVTMAAAARQVLTMLGITAAAVVFASAVILSLTHRLVQPIVELTGAAAEIAAGDLERTAPVHQMDEIGLLAQAFNTMTAQLRDAIMTLENRVTERTRALETAAQVARAATSTLDPDELLPQIVNLTRERFNLYYVGLFLVDQEHRFAVLRAGTGDAGRTMLAQGHRLEVGGRSMIGQCTAKAEPRIALDVGQEAVRFDNPLLPQTRSEMALPLRSRGQVIGAMTVQSTEEVAFDETDIAVLQIVADQVAVALDNAHLYADAQAALDKMEATHRRYLHQGWAEYISTTAISGYKQSNLAASQDEAKGSTVEPLGDETLPQVHRAMTDHRPLLWSDDADTGTSSLVVPITLRGQPIGALGVEAEPGKPEWSAEDLALAQAISEQFALAAENLRLLNETQRRAARERLTADITAQMRASLDIETVLKTAVREIGRRLGLAAIDVRLGHDNNGAKDTGEPYLLEGHSDGAP